MLLSIVAAILFSISITIQKSAIGKKKIKDMIFDLRWLGGTLIGLIGLGLYFYELRHVDIAVIQPIIATSVIFAIIFEVIFLKRKITRNEMIASGLAFVGLLLIGVL